MKPDKSESKGVSGSKHMLNKFKADAQTPLPENVLDNIDKEIDEINSKLTAIKIALKVIRNET
jgi:hypothetical protein